MSSRNGSDRIWRFRRVDVLFVAGLGVIVYGAAIGRVDMIFAGIGVLGIPLTQRADK